MRRTSLRSLKIAQANTARGHNVGGTLRNEKAEVEAGGGSEKGGRRKRKGAIPIIDAVAGIPRWIKSEIASLDVGLRKARCARKPIGKMRTTKSTGYQIEGK